MIEMLLGVQNYYLRYLFTTIYYYYLQQFITILKATDLGFYTPPRREGVLFESSFISGSPNWGLKLEYLINVACRKQKRSKHIDYII